MGSLLVARRKWQNEKFIGGQRKYYVRWNLLILFFGSNVYKIFRGLMTLAFSNLKVVACGPKMKFDSPHF